jgi:enamine deaminase RidA (YjgF/YER057c/UK114 family)
MPAAFGSADETTLKQAGLDFRHVVMSHVFLDNYENLAVAKKVYKECFQEGNEPACATVFLHELE